MDLSPPSHLASFRAKPVLFYTGYHGIVVSYQLLHCHHYDRTIMFNCFSHPMLERGSTFAAPKGVLQILVERKAAQRVAKIKLGLDGPHSSSKLVRGRSEIHGGERMVCIGYVQVRSRQTGWGRVSSQLSIIPRKHLLRNDAVGGHARGGVDFRHRKVGIEIGHAEQK